MEPSVKRPLTLQLRVWAAVRNNPGLTASQIIQIFKDALPASVSSILSHLDIKGVVYSKGAGYRKDPLTYFTDMLTYEDVQTTIKNAKDKTAKRMVLVKEIPAPVVQSNSPNVTTSIEVQSIKSAPVNNRIEELFNSFTMNECKELYQRLHSIFGRSAA